MRLRSIGLIAVVVLLVAGCAPGGTNEAAGPSEGIAVHGDWVIEVRNTDGSLDSRTEFSNAFQGEAQLAALLAGDFTVGEWRIEYGGSPDVDLCPTPTGDCIIFPDKEAETGALRLSGSETVRADGEVLIVSTRLGMCSPNVAPDDCPNNQSSLAFTSKTLQGTDIPTVQAGQIVEVEVEITFGTD